MPPKGRGAGNRGRGRGRGGSHTYPSQKGVADANFSKEEAAALRKIAKEQSEKDSKKAKLKERRKTAKTIAAVVKGWPPVLGHRKVFPTSPMLSRHWTPSCPTRFYKCKTVSSICKASWQIGP
jgi:hypothetical protein